MKDAFWLAACNARPNQHLVNKNFRVNVNFFVNRIQRLYVKQILNDVQQAESRNGQLRRRNWSLKEEKMPSSFLVRVFYGLPVAPIFEIRAEVRTVPRVKLIFQITVAGETYTHTHTHTHTHTEGCQLQPFDYATVYTALCSRQKGYGH